VSSEKNVWTYKRRNSRILSDEKLHDLRLLLDIVIILNSRQIRFGGHVSRERERYKISFDGKTGSKYTTGKT
jgi:uncharacterized protein (DUF2235 family)